MRRTQTGRWGRAAALLVVLLAALHRWAAPERKTLSLVALAFVIVMAGLTSAVSLVEGMASALIDKLGISRTKALAAVMVPGIIGSLQTLEAIKLILGRGDTLIGRLALFDALTFQWRELRLRRNPDCPVCGDHPTVTALIDYDEFCAPGEQDMDQPQAPNVIQNITPLELKQRLDAGEKITIIDVREEFEWDIANLGQFGARLIPLDQILERRSEIDPDEDAVVLCRSGSRSAGASSRYDWSRSAKRRSRSSPPSSIGTVCARVR